MELRTKAVHRWNKLKIKILKNEGRVEVKLNRREYNKIKLRKIE